MRETKEREPVKLLRADDAALVAWANPLRPPIPSGIDPLDDALQGGFHAESVYVLAAPTGRGKTGLAIQIARQISKHHPVAFLSAELTARQVLARQAAQALGASWLGIYQSDDVERVRRALAGLELYVFADHSLKEVQDILERERITPFLVIDYLQAYARRFPITNGSAEVRILVGNLSLEIANWARQNGTSALVVSSVSREWHKGQGGKAASDYIASAKEAGEIEYDASGVLYLDMEPCSSAARLHIAKHRFGPSGQAIGLRFNGEVGLFLPDKQASLTEEQRTALRLIEAGEADSGTVLSKAMKIQKKRALELVRVLKDQGHLRVQGKRLIAVRDTAQGLETAGTDPAVPSSVPGEDQPEVTGENA